MDIATVTGNPKPSSRTFKAAQLVAEQLSGSVPKLNIDIAMFGARLLVDSDPDVNAAITSIQNSSVVIFASPTYKATYTGLLKIFLDQIPSLGLDGVVAIPLMLGAGPGHALAPELLLKPVLVELGATCPTRALYLLDSEYQNLEMLQPWLERSRRQIDAAKQGNSR